ncbi:tRNA pseudouridine(55) synthase TruB [Novosphingobium acidiphilum]|jgi:tRNA pseudouridine55 synthase|uniref:tRNA pseudouridine(55) synthase TruB n=1 Tax=Novosphingobium acidiphilum TaxID=505248 RepID=UPI00049194C3|nr:tRNA pseudouridine(55) synthase TruB [Novosphingobium acidiphilum]
MSVHGWIVLDKPLGLGSTQAVSAVKRALRQGGHGKAKVGHGGTLDPLATGVLPIALGEATKLAGRMLDATKTYDFTVQFGRQTDTLDREGQVIATSPVQPEPGAVARVVAERFTGVIEQVPPAYSAILIDGRRAYDRARDGEDIDMPTRTVTILHWGAIHEAQVDDERTATLTVTVSKGTYVRSLARDIALALGTVGHVTMLRRVRAGPFALAQAISLDNLDAIAKGASLELMILPLEAGLDDIPALDLDPEQARAVRQGRVLTGLPQSDGLWLARSGMVPVALVALADGAMRVERGFNFPDVAE